MTPRSPIRGLTIGRPFEFPEELGDDLTKAKRYAWLSIALLTSAATFMYFAVGNSEAMKTAWVSDILSIVPPIAYLIARRFELRAPTSRFPYGYTRVLSISFLVTAATLTLFGLMLFFDALMKLIKQERPPIGTMVVLDHQFWAGWLMIAALFYSMCCGLLIGVLKKRIAPRIHDKVVYAESEMNRAEWMSEGAAIVGILLVAFGHWWGDAAAALFISVEILKDGRSAIKQVIGDLIDETPTEMGEHDLEPLPGRVRLKVLEQPWVSDAGVRLREHGHAIVGDVFVVPKGEALSAAELLVQSERLADEVRSLDWRLHEVIIAPVPNLDEVLPPARLGKSTAQQ